MTEMDQGPSEQRAHCRRKSWPCSRTVRANVAGQKNQKAAYEKKKNLADSITVPSNLCVPMLRSSMEAKEGNVVRQQTVASDKGRLV